MSCGLWNAMLLHCMCDNDMMWLGGRVNVDLVCTGIFATVCVCVCVFLQARSNVLTGKYPCTVEEAITLGELGMQVCL